MSRCTNSFLTVKQSHCKECSQHLPHPPGSRQTPLQVKVPTLRLKKGSAQNWGAFCKDMAFSVAALINFWWLSAASCGSGALLLRQLWKRNLKIVLSCVSITARDYTHASLLQGDIWPDFCKTHLLVLPSIFKTWSLICHKDYYIVVFFNAMISTKDKLLTTGLLPCALLLLHASPSFLSSHHDWSSKSSQKELWTKGGEGFSKVRLKRHLVIKVSMHPVSHCWPKKKCTVPWSLQDPTPAVQGFSKTFRSQKMQPKTKLNQTKGKKKKKKGSAEDDPQYNKCPWF